MLARTIGTGTICFNMPNSLYILARTAGARARWLPLAKLTAISKTCAPILHGKTNLDNQSERKALCSKLLQLLMEKFNHLLWLLSNNPIRPFHSFLRLSSVSPNPQDLTRNKTWLPKIVLPPKISYLHEGFDFLGWQKYGVVVLWD